MNFLKRFWKANKYPVEAFRNYLRFATRSELLWDIGIPLVLSLLTTWILVYRTHATINLVSAVQNINNQVLTAVSILAGFSMASMTLLATTDSALIESLRTKRSKRFEGVTIFEMLLSFFQWAIVSQLMLILVGLLLLFVSSLWPSSMHWHPSQWEKFIGLTVWFTAICHVVMATLRNLKMTIIFILNKDKNR